MNDGIFLVVAGLIGMIGMGLLWKTSSLGGEQDRIKMKLLNIEMDNEKAYRERQEAKETLHHHDELIKRLRKDKIKLEIGADKEQKRGRGRPKKAQKSTEAERWLASLEAPSFLSDKKPE